MPTSVSRLDPFRIQVPDADLEDLHRRLERTRWPSEVTGVGNEQGPALAWVEELVGYWRDEYDWRAVEARLNKIPQLLATVDGQPIQILHQPAPGGTPLLLLHGWGATFAEFVGTVPLFTTPDARGTAFDIVIVSPPGFGFSGPTRELGWGPARIADACAAIMTELGYERFVLQGGDFGSVIAAKLADLHPERIIGLHLNYPPDMRETSLIEHELPPPGFSLEDLTDSEREGIRKDAAWRARYFGDNRLKATQPQRIGYALEDSPAGLAGWLCESYRHTCDGDVRDAFSAEDLITNVMIHWVTKTATSSMRLYWELARDVRAHLPARRIEVPTGVANFPGEVSHTPRAWVEKRYNVTYWSHPPRGGHFAALEVPDLFVADVRAFVASL